MLRLRPAMALISRRPPIVTAWVMSANGGGLASRFDGAPECSSIPYSSETRPNSSVAVTVDSSWVGSSLASGSAFLPSREYLAEERRSEIGKKERKLKRRKLKMFLLT